MSPIGIVKVLIDKVAHVANVSGPQYGAQSDPVLDNGMSFILPVLNRPLQYQDFQVLERLVVESVDVYNKWQKKSTSVSGQSAVVQQRQSGQ